MAGTDTTAHMLRTGRFAWRVAMSPEAIALERFGAVPGSVVRGRARDLAVVAAVNSSALVVPVVVAAVFGLGHDQPKSVIQDVRSVDA